MLDVVDADTHIAESESMWKLLDPKIYPRRPVIVSVPEDTLYETRNAFWLIDGNIVPKPAGKGSFKLITPSAQKSESSRGDIAIACREITDTAARLADMDKLKVQIQVIYPTLFLVYLTDDVELEVGLCRAYNRWLSPSMITSKAAIDDHPKTGQRRGVRDRVVLAFCLLVKQVHFGSPTARAAL